MSTSLDNLKRLAQYPLGDHQAIMDMYITGGRSIEHISIRMGMDPSDVINLLEGYGEHLLTEDGLDLDGCGRLSKLPRRMIDEYVKHFYPGIAKDPVNDWITLEEYLNRTQPGWGMA